MKHIKRKFNNQIDLKFDPTEILNELQPEPTDPTIRNLQDATPPTGYVTWIFTDKNQIVKCFKYEGKTQEMNIPEPDPVLIYFNNAQVNYRLIENIGSRKELVSSLKEGKDLTKIMHNLYDFFAHSSSFAIFSFMSMESLVNKIIPDNHSIRVEMEKKTEEYNAHQIQQMDFIKKVKEILPTITKKSFWKDCKSDYQIIQNLKDFRNEIVHTKKHVNGDSYYGSLFITALDFDYASALYAVKNFINYYSENLVEECNCGADF